MDGRIDGWMMDGWMDGSMNDWLDDVFIEE